MGFKGKLKNQLFYKLLQSKDGCTLPNGYYGDSIGQSIHSFHTNASEGHHDKNE